MAARAASASASDSQDDGHAASSKKRKDEPEEEDEGEDEEEEEYEIEKIVQAKRGVFPDGRMGYLVKWRGYADEHNSWVDETDAANAQDLIDAFWKKNEKKSASSKTSGRKPRNATEGLEEESASAPPKKRGRKSQSERDAIDEDDNARTAKKSRKSGTTKKQSQAPPDSEDIIMEDGSPIGDMSQYESLDSWEHLIGTVTTVEQDQADKLLWVYFSLRSNGDRVRAQSTVCREKFPQKLLDFYEQHLKWTEAEADVN
ncbi:uncharacterized protein BT62DRAFT_971168 [Guyanagaster necrorhizus]|uniref:Chromo domain-containing protein n=1 Tax=Guyanagaster necrorhizus TaxID=856835 RepID=A0A9P7VNI5_9AGAR|nr:uncharacterized protein BT62DRAFT_971168 [Guyanagaster necrorhizus MCA 3950]KAG7444466.1 hypothetical protein BT62DRAFT_971168 [Guyanagaster necrorhizus MCA 3950]